MPRRVMVVTPTAIYGPYEPDRSVLDSDMLASTINTMRNASHGEPEKYTPRVIELDRPSEFQIAVALLRRVVANPLHRYEDAIYGQPNLQPDPHGCAQCLASDFLRRLDEGIS